ncbi:MAG: hypothetical protein CMO55_13685 [Verrucomicrobiales bacterium]|nr:hypothetical protein [Verrucomicrobiales bacterium]
MRNAGFLASLILASLGSLVLSCNAGEARPDPALRPSLESVYEEWRQSMATGNLQQWEASTAFSRQIETKNRIISQRLPFPAALFEDPIGSPSLGGLLSLGVLSTGETATSTYFGKANFGTDPETPISDNLIVLHFLKEEGRWKFDSLRIVKLGNDGEILLKLRNSDFSFLSGEEFQPADQLPPLQQPVNPPELLAEAWIDCTGYEVDITINGHRLGKFTNAKTTELVMGGVKKGNNTIQIQSVRRAELTDSAPRFEFAIYAAESAGSEAKRVLHIKKEGDLPPTMQESFSGQ